MFLPYHIAWIGGFYWTFFAKKSISNSIKEKGFGILAIVLALPVLFASLYALWYIILRWNHLYVEGLLFNISIIVVPLIAIITGYNSIKNLKSARVRDTGT